MPHALRHAGAAVAAIATLLLADVPTLAQQPTTPLTLPEPVAEKLAIDPTVPLQLETIGTFNKPAGPLPAMQLTRVQFANVAHQRWLWAISFQQPYVLKNAQIIIYLDAYNNPQTGRKGMGCEVMLSHNEGQAGYTGFAPDGTSAPWPTPRVAIHDGILYLCSDGPLKQENGRSAFRYSILSETREPHVAMDSTGSIAATGPPDSDRKVVLTIDGITSDENFATTEGLDLIWKLQADPHSIAIQSPTAELVNMRYFDSEYRWHAVYGANGSITVTVPRAGTFYPAIVVYDGGGVETYRLYVDGKPVGHFVAAEEDRRQRVHFLTRPLAFKGGEKLTFKVGSAGSHITEDVLLLAEKPPVRGRKFEIQQVASGFARQDGKDLLRLTWITTWPAACTVELAAPGEAPLSQQEAAPVANHRMYVEGLRPGAQYRFRIVAPKPDGTVVRTADQTYTFRPAQPFAGSVTRAELPLKVENPYGFAVTATPISSGVPFARGELGDPSHVRLLSPTGDEVPRQTRATAYWLDGSIKWLLVSFQGGALAGASATYRLEYGSQVRAQAFTSPLALARDGTRLTVATGPLQVQFDSARSGMPTSIRLDTNGDGAFAESESLTGPRQVVATIRNAAGAGFDTAQAPERIEVEESGPLRITIRVVGHHRDPAGKAPFMAYSARYVFYSGEAGFRLAYTWGNDESADFTSFTGLSVSIPGPAGRWTTAVDGKTLSGDGAVSVRQLQDNACTVTPPQPGARRAEGWIDVSGGGIGLLTAVRDFWQLYPKAFQVGPDGLRVDLCPEFPPGTYDGCSKLDEIKLFYYLMGGKYKVRQGVQKEHELFLVPHTGGLTDNLRQAAVVFQEPLIAVCTPERYCQSGVFGDILPATAGRSPEYERICDRVYTAYTGTRDSQRAYGMLNFGDQWGERKVNWANGEYDHHHAFLMQFIRTGERRWYFLGEQAARHAIDVDTCHHGPRLGGEWIHSMGHTGGYFTEQYEGNGIPGGGFTPSHTWTEGFCDWYALSGDPTAAANAALVADHYDGAYLNNYDYGNCRDNGWHLLLTMAAYRATNDPYYLNAARIIVERTLERQTPGGGWHRQMVPGHCLDFPRHRGEANFMLGVLANGLEEYYRDIPDPRVAEAVIGGAAQAVKEMWVPAVDGFRYTSCPNMTGYTANNDMTAEVLFFAYRLGGDPQFGEIAMRAMAAAFRDGIGSIAHLRWTAHIIHNMDLLQRESIWLAPQPSVRLVLYNDKARAFDVRLVATEPTSWATVAQLTTPDGRALRPDAGGTLTVDNAPAGYFVLSVNQAPRPWQLHTTLRYWAVDAGRGVRLQVGKLPSLIRSFAGADAAVSGQQGGIRVSAPRVADGIATTTVTGPGELTVTAERRPWISPGWGELVDPSVPVVAIEGPQALTPGVTTATYRAVVTDLDNDAVRYEWDLGDGKPVPGASVTHVFTGIGRRTIKLTVTDRAGNTGHAEISVSLPPAELAQVKPERLVKVEAEACADQGLDKVQVFSRIGSSGKMISYWDSTKGHWLEWKVPVKTAGEYAIYLRYTSGAPNPPHRALTLDGKSPGAVFDDMVLPLTGGFCIEKDNWAYYAAGGGQAVTLEVGMHRLRLINLGEGVGLDYILLVPRE